MTTLNFSEPLRILDLLEAELKHNGLWLLAHPVDAREHMAPAPYLQFYFLPEQRACLQSGVLPEASVVVFNAPYDFGAQPHLSRLLQLLLDYGNVIEELRPKDMSTPNPWVKVRIRFKIELESMQKMFTNALAEFQRQTKVKGFPLGSAPLSEIRKMCLSRIKENLSRSVPQNEFTKYAQASKFKVGGGPQFFFNDQPCEDQPFLFYAEVEMERSQLGMLPDDGSVEQI